jgi:hypothetical protein
MFKNENFKSMNALLAVTAFSVLFGLDCLNRSNENKTFKKNFQNDFYSFADCLKTRGVEGYEVN